MIGFILVFLGLYTLLNLYFFVKARVAMAMGITARFLLGSFMALMIAAPILVRLLERKGADTWATVLAYTGYTWMALLLIFLVVGLSVDVCRLGVQIFGRLTGYNCSRLISAHRVYFSFCLCCGFFVIVYGSIEAGKIRTEFETVSTTKPLPTGNRFRIAQISDVHLGLMVGEKRLRAIIEAIDESRPDILVSTGDLVDAHLDRVEPMLKLLQDVQVPLGKFAVTGNHEFYVGIGRSVAMTELAGFRVLRNSSVKIAGLVRVAGVDDPAVRGWSQISNSGEKEVCQVNNNNTEFAVLLKHRPIVEKSLPCRFDLQLSGHTHKGQIFPFGFITKIFFPFYHGLYKLDNGNYLYVSRGSGTWGPPIRFLAPPEVTIIDIVHKAD